jgi:Zn-dependent protease with chaperone function
MPADVVTTRRIAFTGLEGENARRRLLLFSVALLILLSTTPILGHHVVAMVAPLGLNRDHLFGLCVVALQSLLSPVHEGFHLLLLAGLIYALLDRIRAGRELKSVVGSLRMSSPRRRGPFERAARRAGQPLESVCVVDGLPSPAFTAGWWRPRIFLAARLERLLTEDELTAVILHESAHASGRDPLKLSAMRFLASMLFYIPALRRMADDLADEAEIAADDRAAANDPGVLASAIVALAQFDSQSAGTPAFRASTIAPGIQRCGLLERRVRRLVGERVPARTHLTRKSLAWAVAALILVWVSGLPMASASAPGLGSEKGALHHGAERCRHHHGPFFSHLFCPGATLQSPIRCAHSAAEMARG